MHREKKMDSDLEEWRYEEFGTKPAYLRPSWAPLATLMTGLEPRPLNQGQALPEGERVSYGSEPEPTPSWLSRALCSAGRQLIALGHRLESRGGVRTMA